MKKLGIVQTRLYHYRIPFYEALRKRLSEEGIEFVFVHGQASKHEKGKDDSGHLDWAIEIRNRSCRLGALELLWQPALRHVADCDLLIVQQENKLLLNYWLLLRNKYVKQQLAFWGHGKKFASDQGIWWSERIKQWMSRKVSWWFAYNQLSTNIVRSLGFPSERITCVQNTIDTRTLIETRRVTSDEKLRSFRRAIGLTGQNVGLFSGTMYPAKQIGFLLESARKIRKKVPDFELLFLGDGPDDFLVKSAAAADPWIHYLGAKFGTDKVPYWMLAKVLLIPAAVGLVIIDSFALEVPLVTTDMPGHGPEIDYLRDGVNGVMVRPHSNSTRYVSTVVDLLKNEPQRHRLIEGCRTAQQTYTLENMVHRFAEGIKQALMQRA